MREILFRGKRCDNGEWVEGLPIRTYDTEIGKNSVDYVNPVPVVLMANSRIVLECGYDEIPFFNIDEYPIVNPETIGQYTGLKDKNCTRIFESDVVACNQNGSYGISTIIYDNGAFYVMPLNGNILECTLWDYWYNDWDIEVIGNIFDNSLEELQNRMEGRISNEP